MRLATKGLVRGRGSKVVLFWELSQGIDLRLVKYRNGKLQSGKVLPGGARTEKFLKSIISFLGTDVDKLFGIVVAVGTSGYSKERMSVSVANALAYAWGIPVAIKNIAPDALVEPDITKLKWSKYITLKYQGSPVK